MEAKINRCELVHNIPLLYFIAVGTVLMLPYSYLIASSPLGIMVILVRDLLILLIFYKTSF